MASSSSFSSPEEKYDVFLSFRGVDTRDNIKSHLCSAFRRSAIDTYVDDRLERGDAISPALRRAIEASKLSVIIFSENYASSSWCLDELVHILKCKKENQQFVVPVFYKIDPSTVREQKGSFEAAFAEHEIRFRDEMGKVKEWRKALEKAAKLTGWDSKVTRPESKLVEEIVQVILKKLRSVSPNIDSEGLVGIEKRVKTIMPLLSIGSADVRVLGIWGMGGIGKTTLAESLFNRLVNEFEGACFLTNIREESDKLGLINLKNKLLSELLGEEIPLTVAMRNTYDKERLRRKRVIVVLDDVVNPEEMETLVGNLERFGHGSRIIVTCRDKKVLQNATNFHLYEVEELNDDESRQLFHLNAFKNKILPAEFVELSNRMVGYGKGVPLALKITGSCLWSKSKKEWEKELNKLKMVPNMTVQKVLRISYDGLDKTEKDIFLDLACFFKGEDIDLVEKVLDGCNFFADVGLQDLIRKSLITVTNNKVRMHDLLQKMGWEIVREESQELGKRSRLWIADDVLRVFKTNTGSAAIEGIFLDMSKIREIDLDPKVFAKMHNLRLLKVYDTKKLAKACKLRFPKGLKSIPDALRYFHWYKYPLISLPADFSPDNLVVLEMPHSQVERLWNHNQYLGKLRKIDLSYSQQLKKFPDLSQAPYLESMNLKGYKSLSQVPSYFQYFQRITDLNLSGNPNIKTLTGIPQSVQYLNLDETGLQELPSLIESLNSLVSLTLRNCRGLKILPSAMQNIDSLENLNLYGCSSLCEFPKLPMNIKTVNLNGTAIEEVPSQIEGLPSLENLDMGNCERLKIVPREILSRSEEETDCKPVVEEVSFNNCFALNENARDNIIAHAQSRIMRMAMLHQRPGYHLVSVYFPGDEIPKWFRHQSEGGSVNVKLCRCWSRSRKGFLGIAVCVVVAFENHKDLGTFVLRSKSGYQKRCGHKTSISNSFCVWSGEESCGIHRLGANNLKARQPSPVACDSDHVFMWCDSRVNDFMTRNKKKAAREAIFNFYRGSTDPGIPSWYVKRCGVRFLYACCEYCT